MAKTLMIAAAAAQLGIERKVLLKWIDAGTVPVETHAKSGTRRISEAWVKAIHRRMNKREEELKRAAAVQAEEEDEGLPPGLRGDGA